MEHDRQMMLQNEKEKGELHAAKTQIQSMQSMASSSSFNPMAAMVMMGQMAMMCMKEIAHCHKMSANGYGVRCFSAILAGRLI